MDEKKLIPHYIENQLKTRYIYYKKSLRSGVTNAIEPTKNWAVQEYKYGWGVSNPSNEWLEELDKALRYAANEVDK